MGHDGEAQYFWNATTAQVSEGSDMLLVGARSAGGDIVTEAVKVGGCNAVKAEVSNGVRARGGGIVAEVSETRGCNAVGAAVAGW